MKLHRAIVLVLMMLFALLLLAVMTLHGLSTMGRNSVTALVTVIVIAAIAGVVFSWRQYFPRR